MIVQGKCETIRSWEFGALGSKVFYTRIAYGSLGLSSEDRRKIKLKLARCLVAAMGVNSRHRRDFLIPSNLALNIRSDYLGKPTLEVLGWGDFSISFSYGSGEVWGAIANANLTCGIDVAFPLEFLPPYPVQRAFQPRELDTLASVHNFSLSGAAGFLWSAKESFTKALGIGFNICDPLDLFLVSSGSCDEYFQSYFSISRALSERLGIQGFLPVQTFTRHEGAGFLSLSVIKSSGCRDWLHVHKSLQKRMAGLSQ
ncbi:MAG: 4'-phosphopantetheinyl transferase superfamily protein [Deltaproteobacteria bacterium]|nr:4'-phosphopantetheinyl transferase superfamily protein [Deltaproteobacteria bacterium]